MKRSGKLTPFGKLVVKALTDQDMTRTQLADTIGTSPQYLSYILYVAALSLDPRKVEKAMAA